MTAIVTPFNLSARARTCSTVQYNTTYSRVLTLTKLRTSGICNCPGLRSLSQWKTKIKRHLRVLKVERSPKYLYLGNRKSLTDQCRIIGQDIGAPA
ncbi:hypothetical protein O988_09603 [Pseudogymnoascus sp. VKM F-3808]|nr:hypothetical protein O988_09603 [Pseudogymnoascus sp. VKM F-3808]